MSFAMLSRKGETAAASRSNAASFDFLRKSDDAIAQDTGRDAKRSEAETATPQWSLSEMTIGHPMPPAAMPIQTKLLINKPGDRYEQEANAMADRVMRMPEAHPSAVARLSTAVPSVQRACSCGGSCEKCREDEEHKDEHEHLQMKPTALEGFSPAIAPPDVQHALGSPGQPLDQPTRALMEPLFGQDFSSVRVHAESRDGRSAQTIGAEAYTVGHDVVFAPGRFVPESPEGRRLIAHELTHVVQQSRGRGAGLQRKPETYQMRELPNSRFPTIPDNSPIPDDPLYFNPTRPHISERQTQLYKEKEEVGIVPRGPDCTWGPCRTEPKFVVTETGIFNWALLETWNVVTGGDGDIAQDIRPPRIRPIFTLLQRHEDPALNQIWVNAFGRVQNNITGSKDFAGSQTARQHWATVLSGLGSQLVTKLNARATYRLILEIKSILQYGRIPFDADLVKSSKRIKAIKDAPGHKEVKLLGGFGSAYDKVTVGFEWAGKRIVSIGDSGVDFEVIGHEDEGIYFTLSERNFTDLRPEQAAYVERTVVDTAGIQRIGGFLQGFLEGLTAPVTMAYDAFANLADALTLGAAVLVKFESGLELPYTCVGSICRSYGACLKSGRQPGDCKAEVLSNTIEQATVIIPLYRQGRQCLNGNTEACGGIAALAFGFVEERLTRLTPEIKGARLLNAGDIGEAAIREAIHRPIEGDPNISKLLERPKAPEKPPSPRVKSVAELEKTRRLTEVNDKYIELFAGQERTPKGVPLAQQLKKEVATLNRNATNTAEVAVPTGKDATGYDSGMKQSVTFDAEMKTNENGEPHVHRRESESNAGRRRWCRFSRENCGEPVGAELDADVDDTLIRKKQQNRQAAEGRLDSLLQDLEDRGIDLQQFYSENEWKQFQHDATHDPERALAGLERKVDIHGVLEDSPEIADRIEPDDVRDKPDLKVDKPASKLKGKQKLTPKIIDWLNDKRADAGEMREATHAEILRRNWEKSNKQPFPANHDAHHIVPAAGGDLKGKPPYGTRARNILERDGIGIDDAENCVPLPTPVKKNRPNVRSETVPEASTSHGEVHTEEYWKELAEALEAVPEGGAAAVLNRFADTMKNKKITNKLK